MGKIETTLKAEITRLARKVTREALAKSSEEIRKLKRRVSDLQSQVADLKGALARDRAERRVKAASMSVAKKDAGQTRLSPGLIKKLRKRLGVTQSELGRLLGVSLSAVGFWEYGTSNPRPEMKAKIIALRRLGRRDVARLLEKAPKAAKSKKKARRKKRGK